jgi:hypothetical protein
MMSVPFADVVFHNTNNIEVTLTIEVPAGIVVSGPQTVQANASVTVRPGVNNCASAVIIASDTTHGEFKQSFGLAAPSSGRPSYLESIDVRYGIASFSGSIRARTE